MVMVSVDDHVVEPPRLFEGRLPAKYADLAPKFVTRDDGTNAWRYEGAEITNVALNAVSGRPKEEYGMEPTSFAELRAGTYDIDERVKDMSANGVLGSLCFPSFPQFCGQLFARAATKDEELAVALVLAGHCASPRPAFSISSAAKIKGPTPLKSLETTFSLI